MPPTFDRNEATRVWVSIKRQVSNDGVGQMETPELSDFLV